MRACVCVYACVQCIILYVHTCMAGGLKVTVMKVCEWLGMVVLAGSTSNPSALLLVTLPPTLSGFTLTLTSQGIYRRAQWYVAAWRVHMTDTRGAHCVWM